MNTALPAEVSWPLPLALACEAVWGSWLRTAGPELNLSALYAQPGKLAIIFATGPSPACPVGSLYLPLPALPFWGLNRGPPKSWESRHPDSSQHYLQSCLGPGGFGEEHWPTLDSQRPQEL